MLFLVNFVVLTFIPVLCGFQHCKTGQYWSKELKTCKICSTCPTNNIIRKPCTRYLDTVCTKFFEFQDFNSVSDDGGKGYHYSLDPPDARRGEQTDVLVPVVEIDEMPTITKDVGQYWKNLAFALIGVLCALIVLATIIVFFACRKLQATTHIKSPEDYDDDADSGYVVIRQIRLAAPQREATMPLHNPCDPPINASRSLRGQRVPWGYRPKRRLLSDLEYTDDVFESEDSAGSRSSRKMALSVIHERSDSEGAAENA
ncbi:uncharacterized protein LOC121380381 [Gigantopelta aegis]|uniref:uncharacterized protein LOC121380381 n=1 Tax=Gigantopelta aegis TaxID=1735272 RepID=UPI001B88C0BD|nr:uncharacterized protein LOC121380381 [Gigantopelta aegis]XP_041365105.1 uncharacterized protein LOC121380381 [Gigantopelta aegis]